jgi:hypothetical protein
MMTKIYSAADLTEAHIVSGMLQANGIDAHVGGHYLQGGIGELAAMDFASVYIDDDDQEAARKLIDNYEKDIPDTEPTQADDNRTSSLPAQLLILVICIAVAAIALALL